MANDIVSRKNPPALAMGFRCAVADEIMVVDFLDISPEPEDEFRNIISTIVFTKRTAEQLKIQLEDFLAKKVE